MEYRGEEVKAKLEGRICSYDKSVPDSVCAIYLTETHIFVSEDNYDGTYTDQYVFPLSSVTTVLMEKPYETRLSDGEHDGIRKMSFQTSRAERILVTKIMDAFHKEEYFTIVSKNAEGNQEKTYFTLTSGAKNEFISEFRKLVT